MPGAASARGSNKCQVPSNKRARQAESGQEQRSQEKADERSDVLASGLQLVRGVVGDHGGRRWLFLVVATWYLALPQGTWPLILVTCYSLLLVRRGISSPTLSFLGPAAAAAGGRVSGAGLGRAGAAGSFRYPRARADAAIGPSLARSTGGFRGGPRSGGVSAPGADARVPGGGV